MAPQAWWVLRQVLRILTDQAQPGPGEKYTDTYKQNLRVSVIDSTALNSRGVYYAVPYYNEVKKRKPFDRGVQMRHNDVHETVLMN